MVAKVSKISKVCCLLLLLPIIAGGTGHTQHVTDKLSGKENINGLTAKNSLRNIFDDWQRLQSQARVGAGNGVGSSSASSSDIDVVTNGFASPRGVSSDDEPLPPMQIDIGGMSSFYVKPITLLLLEGLHVASVMKF